MMWLRINLCGCSCCDPPYGDKIKRRIKPWLLCKARYQCWLSEQRGQAGAVLLSRPVGSQGRRGGNTQSRALNKSLESGAFRHKLCEFRGKAFLFAVNREAAPHCWQL